MKLKLLVAALGVAASGLVLADSYQAEVGAGATRFDLDGFSSKVKSYDANGRYYFKAVKTDNLPLAEAAYLGKNSNFYAGYAYTEASSLSPKVNSYGAGVEVYIPESFLYVNVGASRNSYDGRHESDWHTSVGITPIDGLLLTTQYAHEDGYDANIHAKYVTDIGNGQFINVEAGIADSDDGSILDLGGDYYIDNTFSVGGNVRDGDDGNEYTLRTKKFFTEQFSGELAYIDTDYGNIIRAGISYRF